jgi:predicted amidophosphoribosyltransferase
LNPPCWQRLVAPLQYRGLTRDYLHQLKYSEALHLAKTL